MTLVEELLSEDRASSPKLFPIREPGIMACAGAVLGCLLPTVSVRLPKIRIWRGGGSIKNIYSGATFSVWYTSGQLAIDYCYTFRGKLISSQHRLTRSSD